MKAQLYVWCLLDSLGHELAHWVFLVLVQGMLKFSAVFNCVFVLICFIRFVAWNFERLFCDFSYCFHLVSLPSASLYQKRTRARLSPSPVLENLLLAPSHISHLYPTDFHVLAPSRNPSLECSRSSGKSPGPNLAGSQDSFVFLSKGPFVGHPFSFFWT